MKKLLKAAISAATALSLVAGAVITNVPVVAYVNDFIDSDDPEIKEAFKMLYFDEFSEEKIARVHEASHIYNYLTIGKKYSNDTADFFYIEPSALRSEAVIVGMKAKAEDVIIPAAVDGVPVVKVLTLWDIEAISPNKNVKSITFENEPSYLTFLEEFSVSGFTSLESVTLPVQMADEKETLDIGLNAFDGCNNLRSITMSANTELSYLEEGYRYTSAPAINLTLVQSQDTSDFKISNDVMRLNSITLDAFGRGENYRNFFVALENMTGDIDIYDTPAVAENVLSRGVWVDGCELGEVVLDDFPPYDFTSYAASFFDSKIDTLYVSEGMIFDTYTNIGVTASLCDIGSVYFEDNTKLGTYFPKDAFESCNIGEVSAKITIDDLFWRYDADTGYFKHTGLLEDLYDTMESARDGSFKFLPWWDATPMFSGTVGSITFRDGTDYIPSYYVQGCLGQLNLPRESQDMFISDCAFYSSDIYSWQDYTSDLTNVYVPEGTLYVGESAFSAMGIDTLYLPESVTFHDGMECANNVIFANPTAVTNALLFFSDKGLGSNDVTIYGYDYDTDFENTRKFSPRFMADEYKYTFVYLHSGDINSDGTISIADAVAMQNYLLGKDTISFADYLAGDIDEDGAVTVFDLVLLRKTLIALM